MYLLSLSNIDYILITMFFALVFIIAYLFRHKNETSQEFLNGAILEKAKLANWITPFGLIEVVLAGMSGAILGFSSIYYLIPVVVVVIVLKSRLAKICINAKVNNLNEYVTIQFGARSALCFAILNFFLLFSLLIISNLLAFNLFEALFGWTFVNSLLGVLCMTLIYTLIGGARGSYYNRLFFYSITLLMFLTIVIVGIYQIGGFDALVNNLNQVAINQGYFSDHYTSLDLNSEIIIGFVFTFIVISAIELINANYVVKDNSSIKIVLSGVTKIIILCLFVISGIIAIATPNSGISIPGKQIVTVQAQFPNGEKGYVVKAVDNTKGGDNPILGIIPPMINPSNNILEKGHYNYNLANVVVFTHYLPKPIIGCLLIMLFALLMSGVSENLILLSRNVLREFLLSSQAINKYGEIGELWAIRVIILCGVFLSIGAAYLFQNYFDLLHSLYLILSFFIAPLVGVIMVILNTKNREPLFVPIILAVIVTIGFFYFARNDESFNSREKIIVTSFVITYLFGIIIQLFTKK